MTCCATRPASVCGCAFSLPLCLPRSCMPVLSKCALVRLLSKALSTCRTQCVFCLWLLTAQPFIRMCCCPVRHGCPLPGRYAANRVLMPRWIFAVYVCTSGDLRQFLRLQTAASLVQQQIPKDPPTWQQGEERFIPCCSGEVADPSEHVPNAYRLSLSSRQLPSPSDA